MTRTRLCLQSGVVRRRAFFDGAPLTFPPPTRFHARQRALANCLLRQKRVFVYETLSQDNERFSTAHHSNFRSLPHFTRGSVPWQIAYFGKNAFLFTKRCRKTTSVFRRRATQIFAPCHILRAAGCHTVPKFRIFCKNIQSS